MISYRFIHLLQMALFHSFYGWITFHCLWIQYHIFCSSVDGHLGCFHTLAIVNNAAVNFGMCVSFVVFGFPGSLFVACRLFDVARGLFLVQCLGFSCCRAWALWLPYSIWNLISLIRDQICVPCIGRQILKHWAIRKLPGYVYVFELYALNCSEYMPTQEWDFWITW